MTSDVTKYLGVLYNNNLLNDHTTLKEVYAGAQKFDMKLLSEDLEEDIVDMDDSGESLNDSFNRANIDVRNILPDGQKRVRFQI